ncbi:hypothetical protein ACHQM5_000902 [Ranunculus cassubicifolius]
MACNMNPSTPPIFPKLTAKTPTILFSSPAIKSKLKLQTIRATSSTYTQEQPQLTQSQPPKTSFYNVKFKTLGDCKLGISWYPDFVYDAQGGLGTGTGTKPENDSEILVSFDVKTLYIPPLNSSTTRFLGLPLPSILKIDIVPEVFRGIIDEDSGKVNLEFKAKFWFSIGTIYKAPPLVVETILTSEESVGSRRRGRGENLDKEGKCKLVGVATVYPIDDFFLNTFLLLPNECLAELNATINLSAS